VVKFILLWLSINDGVMHGYMLGRAHVAFFAGSKYLVFLTPSCQRYPHWLMWAYQIFTCSVW